MPWLIDHKHSYVGFNVKHMMIALVRGHFSRYSGRIELNDQDLTESSFSGEIEVDSIDTREPERDAHLRSAEFFDVARFPLITFRSTRIEAIGNNRFRVMGDLTLHGITREVALEGEWAGPARRDPWGVPRTGFNATTSLNRKAFGLAWNQLLEAGGVLVDETVHVMLDIELTWQAEAGGG